VTAGATVEGNDRLRLFLALELPDAVGDELARWSERHLTRGRRVATFHVTLAFLGRTPRRELDPIVRVLREEAASTAPFELEPVRYRETRSVGMVVLADPSGRATDLAGRLHARLERLGVYTRERRAWLPHVTVLRFRARPKLEPPVPELGAFGPSGVAAFLSRLHPTGARYEVLESCSLGNSQLKG
jgi:RNA 2',3'-cyclic 3'-phosphodiesterase